MNLNIGPRRRRVLLAGVSAACAFGYAQIASAQEANAIEELVVTATRIATPLAKVPVSVSAYSQEKMDIKAIRDIRDLALQTPGLDVSPSTGTAAGFRISIRGVDSTAGAATTATYIDDTPIQSRNAALNYSTNTFPQIFDLERVEVLRGPQGTLFGASAQGGAVRFITPAPSVSKYSGYGRAMYSVTEHGGANYEFGVAVGGPIIADKVGFRLSANHKRFSGYIQRQSWQLASNRDSDVNSDTSDILRGALVFKPTEQVTLTPSFYYQNRKVDDPSYFWANLSDVDDHRFISGNAANAPESDHFFLPSLKAEVDLGAVQFTSVTAAYRRKALNERDLTNSNDRLEYGAAYLYPRLPGTAEVFSLMHANTRQRDFTQEFRLNSTDPEARVRWQVGAYYSKGKLDSNPRLETRHFNALYQLVRGRSVVAGKGSDNIDGIFNYIGDEHTEETSKALFANVDIEVIDRLTLTVGARYSENKLVFDVLERGPDYGVVGQARAAGSVSGKPFTPKVALSFQADDRNLFYASYARGYRTGGVNKAVPNSCASDVATLGIDAPQTYAPDTTDSFEVGSKNRLFGGRMQIEASAFYTKWKDIQQQIRLPCGYSIVGNTGQAVSKGFDVSANVRVFDNLELAAAVGYTDAHYTNTLLVGRSPLVFAGQTLGATPWTVNLSAQYDFQVAAQYDAYVRAQYSYKGKNDGPYAYQNSISSQYDPTRYPSELTSQLDVKVGVSVREVDISLFAENVLDNAPLLDVTPAYLRAPLQYARTIRPRTIGIMATSRF